MSILRRLTVSQFRCFEHFTLEAAPGLTVIEGANACGKTALIWEVTKDMPTKLYFNMREEDCRNPSAFMETLASQLRNLMLTV